MNQVPDHPKIPTPAIWRIDSGQEGEGQDQVWRDPKGEKGVRNIVGCLQIFIPNIKFEYQEIWSLLQKAIHQFEYRSD